MSALEAARQQAREALELIHTWAQREQAWDTPRALDFARIGVSIRTLLDATEPPAHDEACEADWGPEGQESPCRCGEWRPSDSCPHENFTSLHSGLGMGICTRCGHGITARELLDGDEQCTTNNESEGE